MEAAFPYDGLRWPSYVLSNHDFARHRTRYGDSEARARAAAVLLCTVRGTPFLYQGEELGLSDAQIGPSQAIDPGGRDGCRAPIPWTAAPDHGWSTEPWLPFPPSATDRSVEAQRADPTSVLALYRRLLDVRRTHPALQVGSLDLLDSPPDVLAFRRSLGDEALVVAVNFSADQQPFDVDGQMLVSSDLAGIDDAHDGTLSGDQAIVFLTGR